MKKNDKKISFSKPRIISHKCSQCGLVSKDVHKSIIYNRYYCKHCLIEKIINNP